MLENSVDEMILKFWFVIFVLNVYVMVVLDVDCRLFLSRYQILVVLQNGVLSFVCVVLVRDFLLQVMLVIFWISVFLQLMVMMRYWLIFDVRVGWDVLVVQLLSKVIGLGVCYFLIFILILLIMLVESRLKLKFFLCNSLVILLIGVMVVQVLFERVMFFGLFYVVLVMVLLELLFLGLLGLNCVFVLRDRIRERKIIVCFIVFIFEQVRVVQLCKVMVFLRIGFLLWKIIFIFWLKKEELFVLLFWKRVFQCCYLLVKEVCCYFFV